MSEKKDTVVPMEDEDNISEHSTLTSPSSPKPKIPDGGWGWMIVLSSLIISLIQDGISFSFGTLYSALVDEFESSKSSTAWIGSLFVSIPLLTGPLMSALVDKYGCRAMTIVAGLISTAGFVLSFFATNIYIMYLTFGIIAGMGLGLTYITAVVSIAFWFDKRRNLAVGLGACGTGIGTFVYAPITTMLLYEFGWRWTVVLLSGTLLNMCVCGALMRDPEWIIEQNKQNSKISSKSSSLSNVSTPSQKMDLEAIRSLLKNGQDAEYVLQTLATSIEKEEKGQKEHHQSVMNLPTFVKLNERVPAEVIEQLQENKKLYRVILENYPSLIHCRSTSEKGLNKLAESAIARIPVTVSLKLKKTEKPKSITHQYSLPEQPAVTVPLMSPEKKSKIKPFDKIDTPWLVKQFSSTNQHPNYFKNMRFPRHSIHRGAILNKNKYRLRASSCPNIYRVSMTTLFKDDDEPWYAGLIKVISLFDEFHFFLMSISTIILFAWFMTPYFYLVDHMKIIGYSKDEASYVLSGIGVANTIGMVVLGWAGDQTWTNVAKTYGVCLILCGASCSAIYFFSMNYVVLHIFGALYGIFLASSFSFTPIMLVELLPLETFTKAYGLQLMCQGLGHLAGPPFAAFLADLSSTWSYSFHLGGLWIIISGVLILVIPYTNNRRMFGSGPVEKELEKERE